MVLDWVKWRDTFKSGDRRDALAKWLPVAWLCLLPLAVGAELRAQSGEADPRPNIVILLADDLGWADLSIYGAQRIQTPELDRLARLGVRFTDFYSAAPVCTPARAALLTGRYPRRVGLNRVLHPNARRGLPASERTLAELLQEVGYRTGIVGKWHLGDRPEFLPLQHGFAEFFGMPYSNDMNPLRYYRGNQLLSEHPVNALLTQRFTAEAIEFLSRARQRQPFFLYLPYSAPHTPLDAPTLRKGRSQDGIYGDVVEEMDWSVGQIVEALRRYGLFEKTALFFTSDNGSWRGRSNGVLRGEKKGTWEGGMRVPLVATLPGRFPPGHVVQAPAMAFDLFTTCLQLAGSPVPRDRHVDGVSLLAELEGGSGGHLYSRPLFYFRGGRIQAVRLGDWKLHVARTGWLSNKREILPELYDLGDDPGERRNLASGQPEIVRRLMDLVASFSESIPPVH